MSDAAPAEAVPQTPVTTTPAEYQIRLVGFESQEEGEQIAHEVSALANSISLHLNLSSLDGITIAKDYMGGLMSLDRGYSFPQNIRPSKDAREGISNSPIVVREGLIKHHMVFNANDVAGLLTPDNVEAHQWALQVVAYECAQVAVHDGFHRRFPDVLLRQQLPIIDLMRWTAISSSWDAFASTALSARMGENPIHKHEQAFLELLAQCPSISHQMVSEYRRHQNVDLVLRSVFEVWGTLVKYAGYLLGALDSTGQKIEDLPRAAETLEGHWFRPALDTLNEHLVALAKTFGQWESSLAFEPIGDLVEELVASTGLHITRLPNGQAHIHIPMTPATS